MDKKQTKGIKLILILHNHQPEGNFPEVFERTYLLAYEPFISELERFPRLKVVLHYSGILFGWLQLNRISRRAIFPKCLSGHTSWRMNRLSVSWNASPV